MKFGIAIQSSYGRYVLSPALTEIAQTAQALGFDSLWTTDQMTARGGGSVSTEPMVTAASLLHTVPTMQLGVAVVVLPYRDALVLAKQAASMAVISGGNFVLGIGVGGSEAEFSQLGAVFKHRGRKTDESIELMRRLWREDDVSFDGEFYHVENLTMLARPDAGVPVWIGGRSSAAIRRAARVGDGWVPALASPQVLATGVAELRQLCQGHKIPTIATMELVVPHRPPNGAGSMPIHISGSTEEMIATLHAYEEAGLDHLICSFMVDNQDDLLRDMRIVANEVMPHFVRA